MAGLNKMGFIKKSQDEVYICGADMAELISAVQKKGASFRFKATGSSMRPSIRSNDILTISPLQGIPPFTGEVTAFRHPRSNRLILHRIVKKKGISYSIRGDNQRLTDAHIPQENILGIVTRVERKGRARFWPDRFDRPILARLYFRGYLVYLHLRRILKFLLRPLRGLLRSK